MLCQNCKKNDATTHLKRIVNGETAEIHLCSECARSLGVSEVMPGLSVFGDFFGGLLASTDTKRMSNKVLRCEVCGFTFDDISESGMPGCPNCYRVFAQRLRPALLKIHGRASHRGKKPAWSSGDSSKADIELLKKELEKAVNGQNYEQAAVIRDRIKSLEEGEEE